MNLNGTEYYYIRNAQNDIIGMFDKTGTQVVSYIYDTWGKLIAIDGSLKDSVGVKNPYRYRGYRYDTETGLYYLNARYYNAERGRFINADGIVSTPGELLSENMFAYCSNNPVNFWDPSGKFLFALPFIVAAVFVVIVAVVTFIAIKEAVKTVADIVQNTWNTHRLINKMDNAPQNNKSKTNSSSNNKAKQGITDAGAPNSTKWKAAKKKIKEGKGKGINVKARNKEEAKRLIEEARPNLEKRPTYEPNPPKSGYEEHPIDNDYEMPHIKWRDWSSGKSKGADGHIFWDEK